jgi:hypothetical protein
VEWIHLSQDETPFSILTHYSTTAKYTNISGGNIGRHPTELFMSIANVIKVR